MHILFRKIVIFHHRSEAILITTLEEVFCFQSNSNSLLQWMEKDLFFFLKIRSSLLTFYGVLRNLYFILHCRAFIPSYCNTAILLKKYLELLNKTHKKNYLFCVFEVGLIDFNTTVRSQDIFLRTFLVGNLL